MKKMSTAREDLAIKSSDAKKIQKMTGTLGEKDEQTWLDLVTDIIEGQAEDRDGEEIVDIDFENVFWKKKYTHHILLTIIAS